jgi:taurine dioxygenase
MQFKTRPLQENFGLEVLDADLARVDDESFEAIRSLWQQDPLLLFRRQNPTDDEFINFSRRFGKIDVVIGGSRPSKKNPELLYISNLFSGDGSLVGGLGSHELVWHTDQIYREQPASGSIFYGVEMPSDIGKTSFCNTALAYDTLPDSLRAQVQGKRATCRYGAAEPLASFMQKNTGKTFHRYINSKKEAKSIEDRTPPVTHDIVLESKATGQRSLYISPNHTVAIEGLSQTEGRALIDALLAHTLQDQFIHTHEWRNGDVIFWDNARLLHHRDAFDVDVPRFAKRTTVFLDPEHFAVPEPALQAATSH